MALRVGDRIGAYEVVRPIATGGTASVWEVRHVVLGSPHALKVLQPHLADQEELRQRFLLEGRLQSTIEHPGIVRVTDVVVAPGVAGLVMDLLRGEALDAVIARGPAPLDQALAWVREALTAVGHAHARGVIHRDLKPSNLFLAHTPDGVRVVVLDFGIAKVVDQRQTATSATLGTAAFMSPEQVASPRDVDHRTDVFSLGAVLYELLTGVNAFEADTLLETLERVRDGRYTPATSLRPELPPWIDAVLARALARDRAERFPSCAAFLEALDAADLPDLPDRPDPTEPDEAPPPPPGGRLSGVALWILGLLALVTVAAAALLVLALRPRPPELVAFEVHGDACARWDATVSTEGAGELVVRQDGVEVGRQRVSGLRVQRFEGLGTPGSAVAIEASFTGSDLSERRLALLPPFDGRLTWSTALRMHADRRADLVGELDSPCRLPADARWRVALPDGPREGALDGDRVVLPTAALPQGRHRLHVAIVAGDHALLEVPVDVEILPPCADRDGDGWLDCDRDCDDTRADVHPGAREILNDGLDNDCDGSSREDRDHDGYVAVASGGDDCDDADARVHPGAAEAKAPNGRDDDCDGVVDEGTVAYDDDGDGLSEQQGDCHDGDDEVYPGAVERPDCRDQDCDGEVDEGLTLPRDDDAWEPNDAADRAHDLRTGGLDRFARDLAIVTRDAGDEEWFRFHSQDGLFDGWGIRVTAARLPAAGSYRVEVREVGGALRSSATLRRDGDALDVGGRAFHDDSGDYLLRVVPQGIGAWCPARLELLSR